MGLLLELFLQIKHDISQRLHDVFLRFNHSSEKFLLGCEVINYTISEICSEWTNLEITSFCETDIWPPGGGEWATPPHHRSDNEETRGGNTGEHHNREGWIRS